jgi:hypothetical protein
MVMLESFYSLGTKPFVGLRGIDGVLVQLYRLHFGYVKSAFQGAFTAS